MGLYILIGGVFCLLALVAYQAIQRYRRLYQTERAENSRLLDLRKQNLPVDLELATSEQLLKELRGRNVLHYITLWPTFQEDGMTLKMEIHNVDPSRAVGVLRIAARLATDEIANEMRRRREVDSQDYFREPDDDD